jgi:PAS domain S-box-containing protein/putative nucleotidyltransferase with HDIG domain
MSERSTVLIAHAVPSGWNALENRLADQEYRLVFAGSGAEALRKAEVLRPDLLIADVLLPDLDGFEVCRRVRADARLVDLPVLLMTCHGDRVTRLGGFEAGADDVVDITDNNAELRARVRSVVRRDRYRRLQEERARLARIVESSPVGLLIVDRQATVRLANPAAVQLLGATGPQALLGVHLTDLVVPEQAVYCGAFLEGIFANLVDVSRFEIEFARLDGRRFPATIDSSRLSWDGQPAVQIIVRDITERKRADQRAAALVQVARRLNAQLELDAVLRAVCEETARALDLPAASVTLLDERQGVLFHAGAYGLPAEFGAKMRPFPLAAYEALVEQHRQAVVIPDVQAMPALQDAELYAAANVRLLVSAPMLREGRLVGGLNAGAFDTRPFDDNDRSLLQGLAHLAAQAISNARLYTESQRRLSHIQALRAVDLAITTGLDLRATLNVVLDKVLLQLRVDAADVLLADPQSSVLTYAAGLGFRTAALQQTRLAPGEGYAGRAALERRTLSIPDLGVARQLKRSPFLGGERFISYVCTPLIAKEQVVGVLEVFHRAPLPLETEWLDFFEMLAGQAAIAIDSARLVESLHHANMHLVSAYDTTLAGWSRFLDLRDKETEGHSQRVTQLTLRLARLLGLGGEELMHMRRGALLHDIGKMGVPDAILLKPGALTEEEWRIIRLHPVYAYEMLAPIAFLQRALDIPYCHHEKWDGSGYPRGLAGEQIPLAARIFAVVDVWDAMCSDRPYRAGIPPAVVREHIRSLSGSHFDPRVVEAFLALDSVADAS